MLMGRNLKSNLPTKIPNSLPNSEEIYNSLKTHQEQQKYYHVKHARTTELPPLIPGQQVRIQHREFKHWSPAVVVSTAETPRSYVLRNSSGNLIRRNRQHIREAPQQNVGHYFNARRHPTTISVPHQSQPGQRQPDQQQNQTQPSKQVRFTINDEHNSATRCPSVLKPNQNENSYCTRLGRLVKKSNKL